MYTKEITILFFVIITMLFSCFGEVYPITDRIEGKEVSLRFYIELKEESFIGIRGEDKVLLKYLSALVDKDVPRINSLLSPKNQMSVDRDLSGNKFGKFKEVIKYYYGDYAMFCGRTDLTSFQYGVRRNVKDPRITLINDNITEIAGATLDRFLREEIKIAEADLSDFYTVEYGSNDVVKIHFRYLSEDDSVTKGLKKTRDLLSQAYLEKDFDALANLVGKQSLDSVLRGLMNGNPDPGLKVNSNEPIGAIDMGSVYIYIGHNKEEETVFLDKYAKYDGMYRFVNHCCFGGTINAFLGSDEFESFIHGKIVEKDGKKVLGEEEPH